MDDTARIVKPWVTFAGCVLVVVVLYWAQAIFVPFALAILLTFVLAPPVTALERWIGRVAAVLVVVTLVFTVLGLAGWGVARQVQHLAGHIDRPPMVISHNSRHSLRGAGCCGRTTALKPPTFPSR